MRLQIGSCKATVHPRWPGLEPEEKQDLRFKGINYPKIHVKGHTAQGGKARRPSASPG